MRLKNKIALITGGSSGIGRETSILFAKEGAKIVVVDINDEAGEAVVQTINNSNGEAAYFHADVSKAEDCRAMVQFAEKTFGRLHVLFNNAGIMHSDDGDAISTEEDIFDLTYAINVKGGLVWL